MKTLHYSAGILLIAFSSSCSTYTPGISAEPDDRYYSLRDAKTEQREARKLSEAQNSAFTDANSNINRGGQSDDYQRNSDPNDYSPNDGSTVVNNYYNNSYDMDDYYDYMYASRIRRFHNNYGRFGYYDPYFTNSYYYNPNPYLFGTSIYSTYSFYNPYVPWGYNTWNSPGFNIGWSPFTGLYFNYNSGWGNPWYMYNNPWRWNSWGYNPWVSPFTYNPWGYNPWGYYGGSAFGNGYMLGYSNALMYNNMMSNPMYYNSYDNNTYNYNNNVVYNTTNYGSNTPGSAGGSSFKPSGMSGLFTKEIGQSVSASHSGVNAGKAESGNTTAGVKGQSGTTLSVATPSDKGQTSVKPADSEQVKGNSSVSVSAKDEIKGGQSIKPVNESAGKPITNSSAANAELNPKQSINEVKNSSNTQLQSGKADLIQQGKPSAVSNYNSAPVKGSVAAPENSPVVPRSQNLSTSNSEITKPASQTPGQVIGDVKQQTESPKAYMPDYNYNTGISGSQQNTGGNNIRNYTSAGKNNTNSQQSASPQINSTKPGQSSNQQQIQRYDTPAKNQPSAKPSSNTIRNEVPKQSAPVQNYQRYEAPKQSAPVQNYQRYQAPKQSTPAQNNQRYEAPRQSAPKQNYQRYEAPKQSSPAQNNQRYQPSGNQNYSQPAPARNSYQTPSRSTRPQRNVTSPSRGSSPARTSPSSGSIRSSSPSKSSSGSRTISSPRKK